MKPRSAIKTDLVGHEHFRKKSGSLALIEPHIDFSALAGEVDRVWCRVRCPSAVSVETMVRILVLKRLYRFFSD